MPSKTNIRIQPCEYCGELFVNAMTWRTRRFCSQRCSHLFNAVFTSDRFWSKVDKSGDCWLWTASASGPSPKYFYGRIQYEGRRVGAHRVAWILTYGPIPEGLEVCHRCDVPLCVRPDHLFLGTHAENIRDAVQKGRHRSPSLRGEGHPQAVLTESQVREVRRLARAGYHHSDLAVMFSTARTTIGRIVRGETWTHLK